MATSRLDETPRLLDVESTSSDEDSVARLAAARAKAVSTSAERAERQHAQGKLLARERLDVLLDPGSFVEVDAFTRAQGTSRVPSGGETGDAVVAGFGKIDGRPVAVYAQDFTVSGGSLGASTARKILKVMRQAVANGVPVIGLNDSAGARIQEGVSSLGGYGDLFFHHIRNSGVVPQIGVVLGPCAGGAVYGPALCDFIVATRRTSHMFVTGPDVVRTVTGEDTTFEDLGGADVHATESGVAHLVGDDDLETLFLVRKLLSYLPANNVDDPPRAVSIAEQPESEPALRRIVPSDARASYDVRDLVEAVVDTGSFFEIQPAYAPNLVVGFARLAGDVVGVVANQPKHLAGVLDVKASEKGARFIRTCDAFHIPIVSLVDVPGFLPGVAQEHGGIIRRGAKLLYAYGEATVPKLTVVTRKAYGGAYIVMGSKHLGADVNLAWPGAEIAVLGAEAAVRIIHKKRLADAPDRSELRTALEEDYQERLVDPWHAAEMGFLDDIIDPADTRRALLAHLGRLGTKREALPPKKHGNMPT
ncbi:MAG: acyl-CoA carboxylase subunit beta [Methanobacteriota archaeon]